MAEHSVLTPDGIDFAPYPMLVETDREKYAIQHIMNFYARQPTNYADYFEAAWRFKYRAAPRKAPCDPGCRRGGFQNEPEISAHGLADSEGAERGRPHFETPANVAKPARAGRKPARRRYVRNAWRCAIS